MTKKCNKCGKVKDVSEFHKSSSSQDGLSCQCKFCIDIRSALRKEKNIKIRAQKGYVPTVKKECSKCGEIKDASEFNRRSDIKDGLGCKCKECTNKDSRAYHRNNKDKNKLKKSCYYENNKDKACLKAKEYRKKNKEIIKLKEKEYRKKNKGKMSMRRKLYSSSNTKYDYFHKELTIDEAPRLHKDGKSMEVLCKYCGKYFIPKQANVACRVRALKIDTLGDCYLYCSEECKQNCPTYRQVKYPKGFKKGTSREVNPILRQMCFEYDNWTCQKCGATDNLHCHHIKGYVQNKILANDIENVITLCKECHKEVHSEIGCRYVDLRCIEG